MSAGSASAAIRSMVAGVTPTATAPDLLHALDRGDLAGATTLSLAGLGLSELPSALRGLSGSLQVLDLAGNRLTGLPHFLSEFGALRVLFGSGNRFAALPEVLGACPALSQIGFRGCGMTHLPSASLPRGLRWLTLTDNALTELPPALGERAGLRKLLLAGNRLRLLPEAMAGAGGLELVRVSANALEVLPAWLPRLPHLAWLAWGGNPAEPAAPAVMGREIAWSSLQLDPGQLGQGSSGEVYRATTAQGAEVAVKLFKGTVSSDGLAEREIDAALAAGVADGLVGALGALHGHPDARRGLVLELIPSHWQPLGDPPSPQSCTRDTYPAARRFTLAHAQAIAVDIGRGASHLHRAGYAHGDLYAHNVLFDPQEGRARLGDLGAASRLPGDPAWVAADLRAWAILAGELLDRAPMEWPAARALLSACLSGETAILPPLRDAVAAFAELTPP